MSTRTNKINISKYMLGRQLKCKIKIASWRYSLSQYVQRNTKHASRRLVKVQNACAQFKKNKRKGE